MSSPLNHASQNPVVSAEAALRRIAALPAPDGLEERLKAGLRAAPRSATIFSWPGASSLFGGWMHSSAIRCAAAAAIVCIVAGGGWQVYSHVQVSPSARVIVAPPRLGASRGFSSAGAMRTPNTLNGPVLKHSVATPAVAAAQPGQTDDTGKRAADARKARKAASAAGVR